MVDRFSCIILSFNVLNIFTLDAHVWFTLHTCWLFCFFQIFFFFMGFQNLYTCTLPTGLRFSISMHIFGLYSPSRCFFFFFFQILIFHGVFILLLSNQVLGSHSPCRCLFTHSNHMLAFFSWSFLSWSFRIFILTLSIHADVWSTLSNHMLVSFL